MGRKRKEPKAPPEPDLSHILPELRALAVPIETLVPDDKNPRSHGRKDVAVLKESLNRFGQRSALVIRTGSNVIQAGHGRRIAALELGWTHIAAVHSDDDDDTSQHYQLADNKTAELSEWDWPRVSSMIGEMLENDSERDDFVLLGWDDGDLDAILSSSRGGAGTPKALQSSSSNEWYTPEGIVGAARTLLGGIDLDPASCARANETVRAASFYTKADNGLSKEWHGRVWLNPPYGRNDHGQSNQGVWSARLADEYEAGGVDAAVLLVNAVSDRRWFRPLWEYPICFCYNRIRFYTENDRKTAPTHGNVLVYFGNDVDGFCKSFKRFGHIVLPVADGESTGGVVVAGGKE